MIGEDRARNVATDRNDIRQTWQIGKPSWPPDFFSTLLDAIRTVCAAVSRPVNVVMGLSGPLFSVRELEAAGVKRISVGGSFARAALGALARAACEVRDQGTFTYARDAISAQEVSAYMQDADR